MSDRPPSPAPLLTLAFNRADDRMRLVDPGKRCIHFWRCAQRQQPHAIMGTSLAVHQDEMLQRGILISACQSAGRGGGLSQNRQVQQRDDFAEAFWVDFVRAVIRRVPCTALAPLSTDVHCARRVNGPAAARRSHAIFGREINRTRPTRLRVYRDGQCNKKGTRKPEGKAELHGGTPREDQSAGEKGGGKLGHHRTQRNHHVRSTRCLKIAMIPRPAPVRAHQPSRQDRSRACTVLR
jgi:hypothetical protein